MIHLTPKQQLGKLLFFEEKLSEPSGQSCATCHEPGVAFSDPLQDLPVSKGVVFGRFGSRNDMPVSYAAFIPELHFDKEAGKWKGGLFWDGRAGSLEEQAMFPPLNPLEMAVPDTHAMAEKVRKLSYASKFTEIFGEGALTDDRQVFSYMAEAIADYERSEEVSPFTSKYDYYLKGEAQLSDEELRGFQAFVAPSIGNCASCHPNAPGVNGKPPLFTDFSYDNLGVPKNPENPFYLLPQDLNPEGKGYVDLGLGAILNDESQNGKFRAPTLRNVEITPPYMHNGVFKTLYQVIAFYNTRDVVDWPEPEVPENVNTEDMGDLELSNQQVEDLVAFLKTLTDGWEGE